MPQGLDEVFAWLDNSLKSKAQQGAAAGLDAAAPGVESVLLSVAHAKIKGQTGATFAGIVVCVAGAGIDSSGVFQEAVEAVRDRNPEHVYTEEIDTGGPDDIVLIATVPTDYQVTLERVIDKGFLDALDGEAATLQDAAARGIAEMLT
jgi:hypothetical protein